MTIYEVVIKNKSRLFTTWEAAKIYLDLIKREYIACGNEPIFKEQSAINPLEVETDGGLAFLEDYSY
jgi:hypothetical protein